LYGNIWHQGTVYEASAKAVPFLIELLKANSVEGKDEILVLLAHLAKGTSYHDVHQHLLLLKGEAQKDEWKENIQKELVWVKDVKTAVRAGEKAYLNFLDHDEPEMRDSVAYLLASLERPAPALADHIWKKFESEKDESVRTSLVMAFGRLAEPTESNRAPLLALLVNEKSRSVKLAAAMSLVRLAPTDISEDATVILLDAAKQPAEFLGLEDSVWGKVDSVELLAMNRLTSLDKKSALAAERMLEESLETQEDEKALRIAEILLNLSFRITIRREATFDSLGERQKIIVALITTTRSLWREQVCGNERVSTKISRLLRSCGLPDKRDELIRFIGDSERPAYVLRMNEKKPGLSDKLRGFFNGNRKP
jgi:hypothetical protein